MKSALRLAVLGDSIAFGQGASRPTDTVGVRLAHHLQRTGTPTELKVFAVPRARSDDLARQARNASEWRPGIALIIIGANDLTHFVPPQQAAAQLETAVRTLRAAGAAVVVAPAPDLGVVPWVPPQMRALVSSASGVLRAAQANAARAAGARVADLDGSTSAAFAADISLFSPDRFHPSSAGYEVIADALAPVITAAAAAVTDAATDADE